MRTDTERMDFLATHMGTIGRDSGGLYYCWTQVGQSYRHSTQREAVDGVMDYAEAQDRARITFSHP